MCSSFLPSCIHLKSLIPSVRPSVPPSLLPFSGSSTVYIFNCYYKRNRYHIQEAIVSSSFSLGFSFLMMPAGQFGSCSVESTADHKSILSSLTEESASLDEAQCCEGSSFFFFFLYKRPRPLIFFYLLNVFNSDNWNYMAFAH